MGKHFVTVCVFCFLCATHSPCSSHVQISSNEKRIDDGRNDLSTLADRHQVKKPPFDRITNYFDEPFTIINSERASEKLTISSGKRKKRDTKKIDEAAYLKKIFTLFGNGDSMNYTGFEQFIRTLHLERLLNNNTADSVAATTTNGNNISVRYQIFKQILHISTKQIFGVNNEIFRSDIVVFR